MTNVSSVSYTIEYRHIYLMQFNVYDYVNRMLTYANKSGTQDQFSNLST